MASEAGPLALNEAQRRAVGAMLRQVERCVEQIESVVRGLSMGTVSRLASDLDETERQGLALACDRLCGALTAAQRNLGVEVAPHSARREICGAASVAWAAVEDTRSDALKGYGPLPPEVGAAVDRILDELAQGLLAVLRLLDRRPATRQRTGAQPAGR